MTVNNQIIQVLNALCEKFGFAIDWTSENVIPYITTLCTKLVTYEIWASTACIIETILLSVAIVFMAKKLYPVFKNGLARDKEEFDIGWTIGSVFAIVGLAAFGITVITRLEREIFDIVKCLTFPEMFIFEYLQGVINGAG